MGSKANYVNIYPFIWNQFRERGYVTGKLTLGFEREENYINSVIAFHEDSPHIGTFTYRLKGFDTQPTDHYMRTYFVAASPEFGGQKKFCMGSIPRHKVV